MPIKCPSLEKLKSYIKQTSVFNYVFKVLHFVMKLFGLYPLKIDQTKNGPKVVICVWGVILTVINLIVFYYCFFDVLNTKSQSNMIHTTISPSIVDKFGAKLLLYVEGLTVILIFISALINIKAEEKMLSLFYQAENMLKNQDLNLSFHIELLKMFSFSSLLFFKFVLAFIVSVKFFLAISHETGALIYVLARVLPHFYIQLKAAQYVLYVLMLHFRFNGLNNAMITK